MPDCKTSPRRVKSREREENALEKRKAGWTYKQIGQSLGITEQGAYKCVVRALHKLTLRVDEKAEELRRLELERLDAMLKGLWPHAMAGNQASVDKVLKIMERRARLLGLDAPTKTELTGADGGAIIIKAGIDPDKL